MSGRTKLILLMVAIVVIFAAILCADIYLKSDTGRSTSMSSVSGYADNALFRVTEALSERLPLDTMRCGDQRADRTITLSKVSPDCTMRVLRDSDHEVRKAELTTSDRSVPVYIFAVFEEDKFPERKRKSHGCIEELRTPRLEVEYVPRNPPDSVWDCWLKQDPGQPVSIVALKEGGKLNLRCIGCDRSDAQTISLTLR